MAGHGLELATGYLSLTVESAKIGSSVGKLFSNIEAQAGRTGKASANAIGKAFEQVTPIDYRKMADQANTDMLRAQRAVQQSSQAQQDALRKVEIAEQRLAEMQEKGTASKSQILAQEDRVALARQKAAVAADQSKTAETNLASATDKAAEAAKRADKAQQDATQTAMSFKQRIGAAFQGDFSTAFRSIKPATENAGESAVSILAQKGKNAAQSFGNGFANVARTAFAQVGTFAAGYLSIGFAKQAVAEASNLEQSIGGIEAVFKQSAGQMLGWSKTAYKSVGLSQNQFNELGLLIGAQLKNGGTSIDQIAGKTRDLISVGSDLSAQFGGSTKDAVEAISSALKGERDPIERYGVSLNQAKVDAEAASLGFKKVGGNLSTEANQAATLSLIMKQTTDAHGAFARESDTLAHKQQVAAAAFDNTKAKIGGALLPVVTRFMNQVNKAEPQITALSNAFGAVAGFVIANIQPLAIVAAGITAVVVAAKGFSVMQSVAGVLKGFAVAQGVATAETGLFTGALAGLKFAIGAIGQAIGKIPVVGWIITGITLVVGALTWFFTQTKLGREIWANAMKVIGDAAKWAFETIIRPAFEWVVGFWNGTLMPVFRAVGSVFQTVFQAIGTAATWLWRNVFQPVFSGLVAFWQGVVAPVLSFVGGIFATVFKGIAIMATWLFVNILQPYVSAMVSYWQTVVWPVLSWIGAVFKAVFSLIVAIIVWAWQNVIAPVLGQLVTFFRDVLGAALVVLGDSFSTAWQLIGMAVTWAVDTFITPAINAIVWTWQNVLAPALQWLYTGVIQPIWDAIGAAISWVINSLIVPGINAMVWAWQNVVAPALTWLYQSVILPIWNGIGTAITWVINTFITPAINAMVWAWQNVVAPALQWLYTGVIQPIWNGIGSAISWVWTSVLKPVFDFFGDVIGNVLPRAFQTGVGAIGKFWDGLKDLASKPVEFVVNTIINDGIIKNFNRVADFFHSKDKIPELHFKGFATGGVLPGYTPGRDVHRFVSPTGGVLDLSGGEAIMRPEVTRVLGVGGVNRLNAAARSGGVSGVAKVLGHQQYRAGGVLAFKDGGTTKADDFDPISMVGQFFTDPIGLAKKFYTGLLGSIPGAGSVIGNIVGAIPGRVADIAVDWVKTLAGGGTGAAPTGGTGMGYKAQEAWMKSVLPWAQVTSDVRPPGTKTAGGGLSYHSLGRAVDFIGHGAEGMKQIFTTIRAAYPNATQLIHTPMGGLQLLNGKSHVYGEPDAHMHYNHVHWAMAHGGIVPKVYDRGGWLQPGELAVNMSNRPEPIFTGQQWDDIKDGKNKRVEQHDHYHLDSEAAAQRAEAYAEEVERARRRREALYAGR